MGETSGVGDALDVGLGRRRGRQVRRGCVAMAVAAVLTIASACSLRGQVGDDRPAARTGASVDPGIEWHPPADGVTPPTVTVPGSDNQVTSQDDDDADDDHGTGGDPSPPRGVSMAYR